jgi:predicted TIM-barrel fold metal-dependent hydrolase
MLEMTRLRRVILLTVVAMTTSAAGGEGNRNHGPIIDMHMHAMALTLGPDGKPLPLPCYPDPCQGAPALAASEDEVLAMTLRAMKRHNIVKGFLSGDLTRLAKWTSTAPGQFVASPLIWRPGEPPAEALRPEYAAGRLGGMGELATQYHGFRPNDPALEPYFALAEELDIPVHIHTLGIGARLPGFRVAAGHPVLLEEVLVRHPDLRLFVENSGFPFTSEMIAMMYQYPQLYGDLSTTTWIVEHEAFLEHFRRLMQAGLGKRIMFGSDQMVWPQTISMAVEAIQAAEFLSAEQKADIFYHNAARFLRLSEDEISRHHDS